MTTDRPLADRLIEAFSAYDAEALAPLLAPDVVHWLNITKREQGRDQMLAQIGVEASHIARSTFEVRGQVATAEGFVVQMTVAGETKGGAPFEVAVCLVVTTADDQVVRIDEYASVDQAQPIIQEMFGTVG
jgi:ketosteroid isomerase-like protein